MSMPDSPPPARAAHRRRPTGPVFNPWQLLLLLPLLMLVTPWFNRVTPRLAGLPFFYWYQLAFVVVGVVCVWAVYLATRKSDRRNGGDDR
jgi:Protein of unknown function (DUF3311)